MDDVDGAYAKSYYSNGYSGFGRGSETHKEIEIEK